MDNSTQLLNCPFCGGAARLEDGGNGSCRLDVDHDPGCFLDDCDTPRWYCGCTEEEACEDWNSRFERTCTVESSEWDELACCPTEWTKLSCGHLVNQWREYLKYCPECGAKIVEA